MYLHELVDDTLLAQMIEEGYIRRQYHPRVSLALAILNYTEKAQFDHKWNQATRSCRGLIYQLDTGKVVARPFDKFFNYGEEDVPASYYRAPVTVTDKLDGSLGIMYPEGEDWAIATRGSFTSHQAIQATGMLEHYLAEGWEPVPAYTYLFEIIYPQNRIVLDYGDMHDLVLIGRRHIEYGYTTGPFDDWPGPRAFVFNAHTFQEAIELDPRPNAEGIVVHFHDLDKRIKIKQADYVLMHRVITGLNERRVWEGLSGGQTVEQMCEYLPDDFHAWVKATASGLQHEHHDLLDKVLSETLAIQRGLILTCREEPTRKDFALQAVKSPNKAALFMAFDHKWNALTSYIWQQVKPEFMFGPWHQEEDTL